MYFFALVDVGFNCGHGGIYPSLLHSRRTIGSSVVQDLVGE